MDKHIETMSEKYEFSTSPAAAQLFGNAGRDYMKKYSKSFERNLKVNQLLLFYRCFTGCICKNCLEKSQTFS
jgi:hypothetical protein